jgi:hypothetical protein
MEKLDYEIIQSYQSFSTIEEMDQDDVIDTVIYAFKQTVFMKKMNTIHTTFEGYLYRVVYGMLIVEKRRENRYLL